MSTAMVLGALLVLFTYGLGMFYLGVRAAMQDYEERLARARSVRFNREDEAE